jgi:hypothetical protein
VLEEWWRSVQVAASELHRHFYGTFLERRLRRKERRLPKFGKVQKKKLKENSELLREITSHCGHSVILGNVDHSGAWLARSRYLSSISPSLARLGVRRERQSTSCTSIVVLRADLFAIPNVMASGRCCRRCGVRRDGQRLVEPVVWLFPPGPL